MRRGRIGRLEVGEGHPVRLMGIINVSPESFHKSSVRRDAESIRRTVIDMVEAGADLIDVGGMSSAPYVEATISEDEEVERIRMAVRAVREVTELPISLDTYRVRPALEGLRLGVDAINDVYGLYYLREVLREIYESGTSLVIMARDVESGDIIDGIRRRLKSSIDIALAFGIEEERVIIDPGIGFHRNHEGMKWYEADLTILRRIDELQDLGRPLLIGCSMKSFIGKVTGRKSTDERIYGSIASEAFAVIKGADVIRTHNVRESGDAIRMASSLIARPVRNNFSLKGSEPPSNE
ncbi:MAG: dihydropteroate synthase [Aigarchaeota archaeon]|nr:dihydropteroate synthase [Aigarchaeota archaeon]MDW8092514.1 dihydropteroate synthase [Nitrososphaerota archaeon]